MIRTVTLVGVLIIGSLTFGGCGGDGGEQATPSNGKETRSAADWREEARNSMSRAVSWLRSHANPEGLWAFAPGQPPSVGITGLATLAILKAEGRKAVPDLKRALDWLASKQHEDGSIHQGQLATYSTSIAVLALKESRVESYGPVISKAMDYLRQVQLDEEEGYQRDSDYYGGIGYEKKKDDPTKPNPNLSTTAWALEAARAAGLPKDDPFFKKALIFIQRTQNLSETNDRVHEEGGVKVVPGNDGGAIYQPWASKAGIQELPGGRRIYRSYGSMTYALLKSYIFCDLDPRDPRVRAAVKWLEKNWSVETNPGMEHLDEENSAYRGLFYYWVTLSRALRVSEKRNLDFAGTPMAHWRRDLARAVVRAQKEDGSFVNQKNGAWWESSPILATAYATLVLSECLADGE